MTNMLETSLEHRSCELLLRRGANPLKMGQDGMPDRLILWGNGLHFWVEFKKEKTGKLRPGQVVWKKYLERICDHVYVVDSYEFMVVLVGDFERKHGLATAHRF
jgi:hypothetical protein